MRYQVKDLVEMLQDMPQEATIAVATDHNPFHPTFIVVGEASGPEQKVNPVVIIVIH